MIIKQMSAKDVQQVCQKLRCETEDTYEPGWYFQFSEEDAPIGPFSSKAQCLKYIDKHGVDE